MGKGLVRRLFSALFLALVAAGGGRLSTVDALVVHEASAETDGFRTHYEADSGCHEDGCSMRATAHESRPGPSLAAPAIPLPMRSAPARRRGLPRTAPASRVSVR